MLGNSAFAELALGELGLVVEEVPGIMSIYNKYETAIEKLVNRLVDAFGTTDTWRAVLHTDAPLPSDSVLGDLIQIAGVNGYTTNGENIQFNATRTGGVVTATAVDVIWTAVGGNLGNSVNCRYVSVYDDSAAADDLWCYWDSGAPFTVAAGETFTLDFGIKFWSMS